jgi:hypothetical protein
VGSGTRRSWTEVQARQRDGAASAEPARARLRPTQQSHGENISDAANTAYGDAVIELLDREVVA